MKKIFCAVLSAVLAVAVFAQVNITKVDKVKPTDEMFMEMAVTAAQKAIADGLKPAGAVVILNGAWRSTGLPVDGVTPEENAIAKSRRTKLNGGSIYTINQPTTAALNAIMASGADAVYFVNSADEVIAAGIYTAEDYDPAGIDESLTPVPTYQIIYAPATALIKK